jgi:hypothetical protein
MTGVRFVRRMGTDERASSDRQSLARLLSTNQRECKSGKKAQEALFFG